MPETSTEPVVVIGAGPAGLTAAYELVKRGHRPIVLEADDVVGGISRTVERDGWRFDIGGHRFFTKCREAEDLWREILPAEHFLRRPRLSRIFYRGRLFAYPLRPLNALMGLGIVEAVRCVLSYVSARVRPPRNQQHFEGWTSARFGKRLYSIFFKTYTEKVWGVPATEITSDWAAQRIKNLSLGVAIKDALSPRRGKTDVTSLIEEFDYPELGPGMMWERCRDLVVAGGGTVLLNRRVVQLHREHGRVTRVDVDGPDGRESYACSEVISSMPLGDLALAAGATAETAAHAHSLTHRDFLTVALVVPDEGIFADNWIYVHAPDVRVGRIQNFGSWSPALVKPGFTCLGLEYFVNEHDELWEMPDDALVMMAKDELATLKLLKTEPAQGFVVRMPKAYPVYSHGFDQHVDALRVWLSEHAPNVWPVGRNGMHRYNNQDHSMITALRSVENIMGAQHDVWSVNVEEEYLEERRPVENVPLAGTGRAAPVLGAVSEA